MIAVVDYGAGNIQSVMKALDYIGCDSKLVDDPKKLDESSAILMPGVGAFGDAMQNIENRGFSEKIKAEIAKGKPFFGICLGMQVLFEKSEETPNVNGLGILKGQLYKFPINAGVKVPQIGWNSLNIKKDNGLFKGIKQDSYVYFVHSYYLKADEPVVSANAEYAVCFDAAVQKDNVWACQFHPEKSGETGLEMLKNFADFVKNGG